MQVFSKLAGTLQSFFRVGTSTNGFRLKANASKLQIRDIDDGFFKDVETGELTVNGLLNIGNTSLQDNAPGNYIFNLPANFTKGVLSSDGLNDSTWVNMPYKEIERKNLSGLSTYDFVISSGLSGFGTSITWASFRLEIYVRINKVGTDGSVQVALGTGGSVDTNANNYARMSNGFDGITAINVYENPSLAATMIIGGTAGSNTQTNRFTHVNMTIQNPNGANKNAIFQISSWLNSSSVYRSVTGGGHWLNTGPISRIRVYSGGGAGEPFATGSYANLLGYGY